MPRKLDVLATLDAIDPRDCDYEEWCDVGMALHAEGYSAGDWDAWSSRDHKRYHVGECEKKWKSFDRSRGITAGTLAHIAKTKGAKAVYERDDGDNYVFGWDMTEAVVPGDKIEIVNPEYAEPEEIPEAGETSQEQLTRYVNALFKPGEFIGFTTAAYKPDDDDKYKPHGCVSMSRENMLKRLAEKKSFETALSSSLEDYGAWICVNPTDGKGRKNENIVDFRHTLAESDELEPEIQLSIIRKMRLPCAAIVSSGGKSIHAVVKIDAADESEYRQRVDELHKILNANGFKVDKQCKNPSRLSRMPGAMRDGRMQVLIDTDCGMPSWSEWYEWAQDLSDDLPGIETWDDVVDNLPELSPELISGILRKGHKMLVSGPSKVGKSWLLIELARAIATGGDWIGFNCRQGHVVYVNLEIDRASFLHRIKDLDDHLDGMDRQSRKNLHILNLRGHAASIAALAPRIIRKVKKMGEDVSAIIIDPLYKVMGNADENAAGDVAQFLNVFDHIAESVGCSMIYCHHFSKGAQDGKRSLDMASGSGVFGRDPDASLAIEPVRTEPGDEDATPWRVSFTLREFKEPSPVDIWFSWPCHTVDGEGEIRDAERAAREDRGDKTSQANKDRARKSHDEINEALAKAAEDLAAQGEKTTIENILTMLPAKVNGSPKSENKLRKWLNRNSSPWCIAHYDRDMKIAVFDPSEDEIATGF